MATKFLEPGGDADFAVAATTGFWTSVGASIAVATDFVHGSHVKSIKYPTNATSYCSKASVLADAGSRTTDYLYFNALPNATATFIAARTSGDVNSVFRLRLTSGGVLQLFENTNQIGSNGATLFTGQWYRISIAYTITSTTVNRFEVFVNAVSSISVTNATITSTGSDVFDIGNLSGNATIDFRSSDHYIDDSNSLTDTGDIWVTAKRPNANGTANNFSTQIGAGGSGYGTGHSPQVNERPLSNTNGWSIVAVGATTEEYNIENFATGDFNLAGATIIDYLGWVDTKALVGETGQIVVNGVTSNISITSTEKIFTKIAGSTAYPAGSGTDIGIITDATATTVSLYECGIIMAFTVSGGSQNLSLMGAG